MKQYHSSRFNTHCWTMDSLKKEWLLRSHGHAASKEPIDESPFVKASLVPLMQHDRVILDHWSRARSSQRNTPSKNKQTNKQIKKPSSIFRAPKENDTCFENEKLEVKSNVCRVREMKPPRGWRKIISKFFRDFSARVCSITTKTTIPRARNLVSHASHLSTNVLSVNIT